MSMSDPIADMLTRIRNAQSSKKKIVSMPSSTFKIALVKVLHSEGYIDGFDVSGNSIKPQLNIHLKYYADSPVISEIKRISKPGLRVYKKNKQIDLIMGGLGVAVLSTPKGVISDKQARQLGVGGELLFIVS